MKEATSDFLNKHSLNYIEMALKTDRTERVRHPDGYGKRTGECGDTVEFFIQSIGSRIQSVSFWVQGCIHTNACCNTVARLSEGRTLDSAWDITPDEVVEYLETLPEDHFHCAELSVGALFLALKDVESKN